MTERPIDKILPLLDRIKKTGPDRWIARCPAHDDRQPSLSIKEADDGKILLKCWTGCGASDVVNALGLSLADLFPGDRHTVTNTGPVRRPSFDYRDAMTGVAHEILVSRLIIEAVNSGQEMDAESLDRLALAETRISDALSATGGVQ